MIGYRIFTFLAFLLFFISISYCKGDVYSSCSLTKTKAPWIKGTGAPIKSWVKSVVPIIEGNHEVAAQFDSDGDVSEIGRNGSWIWSKFGSGLHDGWLYRKNPESDQITYIYDDSSTVIHGIFHDRTLVEGRASKIVAFRCNNGIMDIKLSKKMSSDVYKFHQITEDMPPKSIATRVDPLEKNQIYVGPSEMEGMSFGEGVFAKRSIPAGQLIAVYSGYLLHVDKETYYANMTIDDREDVHKNWLHYNDTYMIDVLNLDLPKST